MISSLPFQIYLDSLGDLILDYSSPESLLIHGASSDSRQVKAGWLFCAIPGTHLDGATYIPAALAAGAVAIVSSQSVELPPGIGYAHVKDAYAAAGRIAACAHGLPANALNLLAVTGTNGKTTCAFLLRDLLRQAAGKVGMVGTVAYTFGDTVITADRTTPEPFQLQSLLRRMVDDGVETAVMEVSSHALVQNRLGQSQFSGAIFTNLTGDHLDYHRTSENYYQAKKSLFTTHLTADALAVINVDDGAGQRLADELRSDLPDLRILTYGEAAEAAVRITNLELSRAGCAFNLSLDGTELTLFSPLIGRYNVSNLAAAAALAHGIGITSEVIRDALQSARGAPGRLEAITAPSGLTIFVDYAHTDDALQNVLMALEQLRPSAIAIVFGCGGDRDCSKRPRMGRVAASFADRIYITNDNPRSEDPDAIIAEIRAGIPPSCALSCIPDRREAIRTAIHEANPGDFVLVAGKGHETYQISGEQQLPFNDVQEVKDAIAEGS